MMKRNVVRFACACAGILAALCSAAAVEVSPTARLFFAGDSTLDDAGLSLGGKSRDPYRSWGTTLQTWMKEGHVVRNYARSGASTKSFEKAGLWKKLIDDVRAGDFVAIQFGHNDQKRHTEFYLQERWADPKGLFREIVRRWVGEIRAKGATPILLSPICRGTFDAAGRKLTDDTHKSDGVCLGSYREAMCELAQELTCDYVDMNTMTRELMESLGRDEALKFFVISTGLVLGKDGEPSKDVTHPIEAGAKAFASLFIDDVTARKLPVAELFRRHPEISWSVMHPTAIDTNYMARVAAKAVAYGGVDSFEVCGDCHRGYSGINGLSMLEKYPHAAAKVDRASVEKNRCEMRAICDIAHGIGKPLYYWHREIFIPEGLLEDLPSLLDADGEFDLLGKTYQDWLRYKLDETFRHCPGLDGIVLTLTEADYSVIHNSNPQHYPPQKVVEELVGLFAEEHEKRGKRFILRSFGSNSQDYIDIIGGAKRAAAKHGFEIETKVTEADFVPWLPKNPFLRKNPPLTLGAECDALGEYLSAGYLPAAQVGRIREYVASAREEGVDRYTIRIDRVGNSIFDSAHEVNLYAYMRFIADPAATTDGVIADYAAKRFGAAADEMVPLVKNELEMIRNIHYVASNLVFHSFPLKADFKTVKAGGIFSVYRENRSLEATKDIWSILSWMRSPTHAQILDEKAKGLAMAEAGLRTVEALKGKLPPEEYARQHRAFAAAVKAAKALQAYAQCCVAYFADMAAKRDDPIRLRQASDAAVTLIESLMTDPADNFTGRQAYFSVVGENLDRVYFTGLRFYCRELLNEYACERRLRRQYEARPEVVDFVTVGGIYDDNRTIRTMHGAYTKTLPGRVVRQAGNPVFPNGTVSVRFRDVPGATVEVALDPTGAQEYDLKESVADGVRTVTIGKKGRAYPALLAIALVKSSVGQGPIDVSFARGKWNPDDFAYVKSWRWPHFNRFEQTDDGIVNLLAPDLTPEQVYKTCHDSSYVAMLHRRRLSVGTTISSTMRWDYRMAPIIVLAPDVGVNAAGVPELRDHWEVCLYDKGINVWYHFFENGKQQWYKAADFLTPPDRPFKADVRHELVVKTANYQGHRRLVITCGDVTFAYVDDRLPETFYAGVIGCEGRNWFYDFKAR